MAASDEPTADQVPSGLQSTKKRTGMCAPLRGLNHLGLASVVTPAARQTRAYACPVISD